MKSPNFTHPRYSKFLTGYHVGLLRREKGLSQVQLANALGISNSAVSHWECGRSNPSTELQLKLFEFFGLNVVNTEEDELPKVTKPKVTKPKVTKPKVTKPKAIVEVEKPEAPKEDSAWVVYALTVIGAAIALMVFISEVGI